MLRWNVVVARVRALFRREAVIDDIDEEMRIHVDMATEDNVRRGMAPAEARAAALREFGNLGCARDTAYAVRGGGMVETLTQDIRFGGRMLRKHPGVTLSAVITMALGIGATSAVFSVVNPLLLRGLPFPDPDRLMNIRETCLPKFTSFSVSPGNFLAWRERSDAFAGMAAFQRTTVNLTGGGEPERLRQLRVTSGFFELFGATPIVGRGFLPDEDAPGRGDVVVLSGGFWQRRFGADPDVVHRTLMLDGKPYVVAGVMAPGSHAAMGEVDVWTPAAFSAEERERYGSHYLGVIARLAPTATVDKARAQLDDVARALESEHPGSNGGWRVKIDPLSETVVGGIKPTLVVLSGAVAFLLLIACANVASLLLGRAASREREIAVRVALGAGRGRILRQLAAESALLALLGGGVGLALGTWGVDLLLALAPQGLAGLKGVRLDLPLVAFAFLASLAAGLIVGLAPALQAFRVDVNAALKEGGRGGSAGGGHARVRRTLVAVEVAACVLLLVGAGLLIRSLDRLLAVDPGFDAANVTTVAIDLPERAYAAPAAQQAYFERATRELATLPGVRAVAAAQTIPFAVDWVFSFSIEGRPEDPPGKEPSANYYAVTPDYFRAMGIRVVRGRAFTEADGRDGRRVAIINEKLARQFFPDGDALGKRIGYARDGWQEIVGIAADTKQYGLTGPATYQLYEPMAQRPVSAMTLVVRGARDPAAMIPDIRARLAGLDADQPLGAVKPLEQIVSESVSRQRFAVVLLGIFAGIALVLAIVGIYGVISDAVTHRTREIGIRLALGARAGDCIRLMMGQGIVPVLVGLGVGLVAALAATPILASLLYEVSATDPVTLGLVTALIAGVALVASYVPARRVTRVDPMAALRAE